MNINNKKIYDLIIVSSGAIIVYQISKIFIPSLNVCWAKLVNYLKEKTRKQKMEIFPTANYKSFKKKQNLYIVKRDKINFKTKNLIGARNKSLFKILLDIKKRQLFILNLNLNGGQKLIPHIIFKIGKGIVYFFIKKIDGKNKLVLEQKNIYHHSLKAKAENYFQNLINHQGLVKYYHFLKRLKYKKFSMLKIKKTIEEKVWAINCGNAIRSLIEIGGFFKYAK